MPAKRTSSAYQQNPLLLPPPQQLPQLASAKGRRATLFPPVPTTTRPGRRIKFSAPKPKYCSSAALLMMESQFRRLGRLQEFRTYCHLFFVLKTLQQCSEVSP